MNILRFQTNVPNEVSLESQQGVVVQGRYGDRMMFNLTDGQVMYVPTIVAHEIEAEGIGPGEPFEYRQTPPNAANWGCLLASFRCFVPTRAVTFSM